MLMIAHGDMVIVQEALRTCFESTVIPSFERSCRSMFEQVESSFQHGMAEYTSRAQQELASSHSALASTLQVGSAQIKKLSASPHSFKHISLSCLSIKLI